MEKSQIETLFFAISRKIYSQTEFSCGENGRLVLPSSQEMQLFNQNMILRRRGRIYIL